MPRPKRTRRVNNSPHFKGFMPSGAAKGKRPVVLFIEEYEAIRLCDYELHGQVEAASLMNVSRPTFSRIYESARRKVAEAFVKGEPIVFEGGKVYFDSEWYACNNCGSYFNHTGQEQNDMICTLCGSNNIVQFQNNKQGGHCYRKMHACSHTDK